MAELITERFEGTSPDFNGGDEESWTDSFGTGSSQVLGTYPANYGSPAGGGNRFRRLVRDGTSWDARKFINFSAFSSGGAYLDLMMAVVEENLGNNQQVGTCRLVDTSVPEIVAQIALRQDGSGNLFWRLLAKQDGTGNPFTAHDGPAVSVNSAVYRHQLLYDFDGSRLLWYVDGVLQVSATGITTSDEIGQFLIGTGSGDTQVRTQIDYDRILLDNESWPEPHTPHRVSDLSLTINGIDVGDLVIDGTGRLDRHIGGDPDALSFALHDSENRVIDSEELDSGNWTNSNASFAPDDTGVNPPKDDDNSFFIISEDGTSSVNHRVQQGGIDIIPGKAFTATCWYAPRAAVIGGREYEIIVFQQTTGDTFFARFDQNNGIVTTGSSGSGVFLDASIEEKTDLGSLSGSWWRVTVTGRFDDDSSSTATFIHSIVDGNDGRVYDGLNSEVFFIWNPQLARGGPTQARFDIVTGSDPYQHGPDDLDEVILNLTWKEADGAPWGTVREFGGHVVEHSRQEITDHDDGRQQTYEFEAAGYARLLGRRRFDAIVNDGATSNALSVIEALVSDDDFTLTVDSGDPTIAGDQFAYSPAVTMIDEVARRAGRIWNTGPGRTVSLFIPGTEKILTLLDRDDGPSAAEIPFDSPAVWRSDSRKLANEVRVQGEDILVTASDGTSQSEFTLHQAPRFEARGMKSLTDAQRVAQSLLAGLKDPILSGTITTWKHGIEPGQAVIVTDKDQNIIEQEAFVRSVSMQQSSEGGLWISSLELTTEELLSALGILTPVPEGPRPGDPLPGTELFIVNGPIPSPNAGRPTPASDEVIVHLRFNEAEGIVGRWRVEWEAGGSVGGTGANFSSNMFFRHQAGMTVSASAPQSENDEDAIVIDDGSRNVRVTTSRSGADDFWQLEVGGHDVLLADPSVLAGTLRVGLFFKDAWITEVASITIGDFTVATDVSTGNIIRLVLPVDPSTPLEAGSVGSTELADGSVTTSKLGSGAVTTAKISAGAVGTTELSGGAVTTAKISAGAVGTTELAGGAVTTAKITSGAVTSNELGTDSVTNAKISDNAVDSDELATGSVVAAKIGSGAVTAAKLGTNSVTTVKINGSAVTTAKINNSAVTTAKINNTAVTEAKLSDQASSGVKLHDNVVQEFIDAGVGPGSQSGWDSV